MKKNNIYISIAVLVGVFLGYLIFGNKLGNKSSDNPDQAPELGHAIWTCSMDPQVKKHEPGDCPICGMDLIPLAPTNRETSTTQFSMTAHAMALANIQTSVVGASNANSGGIKLSGKIKENEEALSVQVTHFAGRIEKLFVKSTGQKVNHGQLIATIYAPGLVAAQQELLTAASLKKTQPELYKAVRNKLKIKKISEAQIDAIESSGAITRVFPVYSHFSGIVSEKMIEEGDHVAIGQVLYKITNLNTVWASFDVYENQISSIKEGQEITIRTNAYPTKNFTTTISFIDPVLNTETRTITARSVLENKEAVFKPGMFIEGRVLIETEESKNKITVPKSAVLWTGKRSVVYIKVQTDQHVFEMREVTLGNTQGDSYVILDGLTIGEKIVTHGAFTVDAAAQLHGKKSMMNH